MCRGSAAPGLQLQRFIVYTKRRAVTTPQIDDDRFALYASRTHDAWHHRHSGGCEEGRLYRRQEV